MKLRCYLRGIGLGILVTAALFLSTGSGKENTMTDSQVIARAKELGMVDNQYLSDYTYPTEESESVSESLEVESEPTTTEEITEATSEAGTQQEVTTIEEESEETVQTVESDEIDPSQKYYVIVVNKGDGSDTVSQKVFETGLVPDAVEFDHYLMENGYDRKITTGNHEIPSNATMEQMAKILCSN